MNKNSIDPDGCLWVLIGLALVLLAIGGCTYLARYDPHTPLIQITIQK